MLAASNSTWCDVDSSTRTTVYTLEEICGVIGITGSLVLLLICIRSGQWKCMLGRLVTLLAMADFLFGILCYSKPLLEPCPNRCGWYEGSFRLAQVWSVVLSAAIALAILCALLKKPFLVSKFHIVTAASLPVAFVLNSGYIVWPSFDPHEGDACTCASRPEAVTMFEAVLGFTFCMCAATHIFGIAVMRSQSPASVVRRAHLSASRYVVAFLASYGPYVLSRLLFQLGFLGNDNTSCTTWWVEQVRDMFYDLAGFFNLIAYQAVRMPNITRAAVTFGERETRTFARDTEPPGERTGGGRRRRQAPAEAEWELLLMCDDEDLTFGLEPEVQAGQTFESEMGIRSMTFQPPDPGGDPDPISFATTLTEDHEDGGRAPLPSWGPGSPQQRKHKVEEEERRQDPT